MKVFVVPNLVLNKEYANLLFQGIITLVTFNMAPKMAANTHYGVLNLFYITHSDKVFG